MAFDREHWYKTEAVPCYGDEFMSRICPYAWTGPDGVKCDKECRNECKRLYGEEP